MKHYLYGFTIYSIQSYIFQTNKLKEIAGASELVEKVCTTEFAKMLTGNEDFDEFKKAPGVIRNAAGNIRYLFNEDQLELCKKVVKEFPKRMLEFAPGVQIGQAVIETNDSITPADFKKLEKLLTDQRNNLFRPIDLGYMAANRARKTGLPSVERKSSIDEILINDKVTKMKLDQIDHHPKDKLSRVNHVFFCEGINPKQIPIDIEKIVSSKSDNYSWLAVIHADGNNMGQALKSLEEDPIAGINYSEASKLFSDAIDRSTKEAAQTAFQEVINTEEFEKFGYIPFRPIIIGGDDLTIICRADFALEFTKIYLHQFKEQTKINFTRAGFTSFLQNGLTACAGIAFAKVNYPFHYAIDLAESLCSHAKRIAKANISEGQTPSCLMFHKVLDSFVERYSDIIKRELSASSNIRFDFGPYYIDSEPKISTLLQNVSCLEGKEGNAIKSGLRRWLTELHNNKETADQLMTRLLSVGNEDILKKLNLGKNHLTADVKKSPVYDWLTILSIQ